MLLSYQHTTTILCYLFSDGWAKDDLIYQWKQKDPVQVVPNLHLPRFTLEQYKSAYCDVITNTGNWLDGVYVINLPIFRFSTISLW